MTKQPTIRWGVRALFFAFCWTSTLIASAHAMAGDPSPQAKIAQQAMQQGEQALREKRFALAADRFEQALQTWQQLADAAADADSVRRQLQRCRQQLEYALNTPLHEQLSQADALVAKGQLEEATERFLKLVDAFGRALQRLDSIRLEQNRMYCANQAGLAAIRYADRARKQGHFAEAAAAYRLAIQRYEQVHEMLGEQRFVNNVKYAQTWLPQVEFENRLAQHAPAPDFELPGVDGSQVRLADYRGKTVLLVVWAAWCGHCRADLPVLNKFHVENASQGVQVVGLCVDRVPSWNHGKADDAVHLVHNTLCFPNAWADSSVLDAFGHPTAVPTAVWIDPQGRWLGRASLDGVTLETLAQQLQQLSTPATASVSSSGTP